MIIFPFVIIIISAITIRLVTKSWLSPGSFFSVCWGFFLLVPLIFAYDYKIDMIGLWFISIFTMALASGSLIAYSPLIKKANNFENILELENYKFLNFIFIFFNFISFFGLYLLLQFVSNIYISNYYNTSWLTIPNLIAVDRYGSELNYPTIIKYSLYLIYPANLLGGLLLGQKNISTKSKFLLFIPLFQAIVLGVIEGARTSILLGSTLFFSSWLSTFVFKESLKETKNTYIKTAVIFIVFLVSFIFFFVFIQWLRQGMDPIVFDLLIDRIRAYFFGYLAAFTQWIGSYYDINTINDGFITFAGPFNLAGIMERPLGFYESINIGEGVSTNIFTAFRGLVTDFTIIGSIIIAFLIGFTFQFFYQNISKMSLLNTLPISMFYAFTLYSPLISIFHYNSIFFSWLIVSIALIFSRNEDLANNS